MLPPTLPHGPSLSSSQSQGTYHYLRDNFSYLWKSVLFSHFFILHSNFLCVSSLAFSPLQFLICLLFIMRHLHWYAWLCATLRPSTMGIGRVSRFRANYLLQSFSTYYPWKLSNIFNTPMPLFPHLENEMAVRRLSKIT